MTADVTLGNKNRSVLHSPHEPKIYHFGLKKESFETDVVFRDGVWYLRQSTNGISIQNFGMANDKPVPAAYLQ